MRLHKISYTLLVLAFIVGCGYKPVSKYAKGVLKEPVYIDVKLSKVEPQNGIFLKDEILKLIKTQLHQRVANKRELASSVIEVPNYHFDYSVLTKDKNGYVTRYRIKSYITFNLISEDRNLTKTIKTSEDVNIEASSLTSEVAREVAIKTTIKKAMDSFLAYLAQEGLK